jgi:hypothetical protein
LEVGALDLFTTAGEAPVKGVADCSRKVGPTGRPEVIPRAVAGERLVKQEIRPALPVQALFT